MRVIVLEIHSWADISIGVHYYGALHGDGGERYPITRKLSKAAAFKLNRHYCNSGYTYKVGDISEQFDTHDQVCRVARRVWKDLFPKGEVLLEGSFGCADPQRCLDGPLKLRNYINKLYNQAEKIGWYDGGNEEDMDRIHEEFWYDIMGHERPEQ